MEDLGTALACRPDLLMLGGGNPAHIPEVQRDFRDSMQKLLQTGSAFDKAIGDYDPPQGNPAFIAAVCDLLNHSFHWNLQPDNIVLTNGSQSAFFILFNLFAGAFHDGTCRKILLPLAPEYIGYADVGLSDDLFVAIRPQIAYLDDHLFKYHIDFDRLSLSDQIGAICVSRPTNPTGNVITDRELQKLSSLAASADIPLIIDNAYGSPFPNIIFTDVTPIFNDHTILCMSLSKLGLPAVRTGIVIAPKHIAAMVARANAVISLAPASIGAAITIDLVRSGRILHLSRNVIRPFYQQKAEQALELLVEQLKGIDFYIHKPEGAFFLWLWFPALPITSAELYRRLKARGVIVVPGHYFFPGLEENWPHKHQCIRVSYARDDETVRRGIQIIAEEVRKAHKSPS